MQINYKTKGVCSREIRILLEDGVIQDIAIDGGCNGNLQGICRLVKGRNADDVIGLLRGIQCGAKLTSCPDQLARALEQATNK